MFVNSKQFFDEIEEWEEEFKRAAERAVRKTVKKLYTNIVNRTPVDTGYARSRWRFTTGTPRRRELKGPTKKSYSPPPPLALSKIKFGDDISIYNNAPYIEELEHGKSTQAPNGMVALSMAEAEGMLEREFRKI